ncbi:MAG: hypothetical protein J5695_00820 [Bacteroidales bacterium]|nr:hypothetical protein [Bacteroidales bacterium]
MHDFVFSLMLLGALSSSGSTPFWAQSNQYGLMPERNGALGVMQAYKPFDESRDFQWRAGVSLAANYRPDDPLNPESSPLHPMVDELYASLRWKVLRMDLGMRHRDREFLGADPALGSLSVTEGHIVESNNARTMPGVNFSLEPLAVPFTGQHLLISGDWADYTTIDNRFVQGALVHRLRGYLRYDTRKHFYVQIGLDHYALWGGTPSDPRYIPVEVNLDNYFRICTGRSASAAGSKSDQMNCLGDHGGAEQLRMGWRADAWDLTFQLDKPYNDKSGMRFNNIPDGAYTLHWSLKDKDKWISDVLVEAHYTMWQSGTIHEKETDDEGRQLNWYDNKTLNIFGGDNYFTNGEYKSGWTHFGRMIGAPLFFTGTNSAGITSVRNNRYKAIHLGLSGKFFRKAPYRLMLTFSDNYGTYTSPYVKGATTWHSGWNWWEPNTLDKGLKQFSAGLTGYVPFVLGRGRLDVVYGLYADAGELLAKNFGATAGIRFTI